MDNNNFQRLGATSNAQAGDDFEAAAKAFFGAQRIVLTRNFAVPVGVGTTKNLTASISAAKVHRCSSNANPTHGRKAATCRAPR